MLSLYDAEFPADDEVLHFNHAGIGPWPKSAVDAAIHFARENLHPSSAHYQAWDERLTDLRQQCAHLIGAASADEIAFTKNTSEGLSIVACGIPWQAGDNLIIGNTEFSSNQVAWRACAKRFNIELRIADISTGVPEEALIAQMDANTRLLACSSIQYDTGYRMNLKQLGEVCRKHNALFCIDAIQSLGAVPFNAQECNADFVCADGHKWLLSPEGTGIFYCKHEHIQTLKLNQFGWHMLENPTHYHQADQAFADNATRFECGSVNHLGLTALHQSISLLLELGIQNIYRKINRNINYLIDNIDKSLFTIVTPEATEKRGGILTVRLKNGDNRALYQYLQTQHILCAYRVGGIRLSPHFYTKKQSIDRLLAHLHTPQ